MPTTFDDYLIAIRKQYEVAKQGLYSGYLIKPSPAQLRNLCLLLFQNKLNKSDEEIFILFFEGNEDGNLKKSIANFDVEKFRAIVNFLKGKSERTSAVSLNLIAVLVGFEPRPYAKFLRSGSLITSPLRIEEEKIIVLKPMERFIKVSNKSVSMKRMLSFVALGIVLLLVGYVVKDFWFTEKECMQWQKDHYEPVDCNITGIGTLNKTEPIDVSKKNLIKIAVTKNTPFFNNGKAVVWYCKVNGKPEFFSTHGIHPLTGKALKPITNYIIEKYVKK